MKLLQSFIISCLLFAFNLSCTQVAWADDASQATANIHVRITGTSSQNRYFICLPNVGCLSILAGDHGKTYKMISPIDLQDIYLTDLKSMQVYFTGGPKSCTGQVQLNQAVTISGHIAHDQIENLSCSFSKKSSE